MKHRRDKSAKLAPVVPTWTERLQGSIAIIAVGLALASPLVPSEGAIREGAFAVLAMCWCLLLVAWAALAYFVPGNTIRFGWTEIVGGSFILWHSLAAVVWLGHGNDRQSLNTLWIVITYGLTVLLLRQVVASAERARVLIALMIWLAAALAATGYVQYFVTMPQLRSVYESDPEPVLAERRVAADPDSPQRLLFENRLKSVEPLATFALTNSLAGFLAPWLIVALAIALAALAEPTLRRPLVGAALVAAFLAGCLLLTKSRTAVLAVIAGLVLLGIYGRRTGRRIDWRLPAIAGLVLVVIGLVAVYVGGLDAEVLSEAPKSVLYRLEYWRSTAALIADHPLWGCGPGNFQEAYAAYKLPQASEMVADPHNFLLEIWATAGTPGLVLFLATVVALVVDLVQVSRRANGLRETEQARCGVTLSSRTLFYVGGIAALVLGFIFAALAEFPLDAFHELPVPIVWCVGLPLLALVWWLLSPWVAAGELPVGAAIVGLLVLTVNLLAAGAATFPGVALTAIALVPIALELAANHVARPDAPRPAAAKPSSLLLPMAMPLSRGTAAGLCGAALALALLCLWTEYKPVLNSRLQMQIAMQHFQAGETAAAEKAVQAAASADPWSPEPWRILAELHFQQFMAEPGEPAWSRFVTTADEFRRRNPGHHGQFFQRGNWFFLAWQRCRSVSALIRDTTELQNSQPARLTEALDSYRQAIDRYPNHALYYGQLAWALAESGDLPAARQAADRAKALDDAMPHADQKLTRRRIADWQPTPTAPVRWMRPESAELTVELVRTTQKR
jgi:tetratricopeptide (TPR) repeat protein